MVSKYQFLKKKVKKFTDPVKEAYEDIAPDAKAVGAWIAKTSRSTAENVQQGFSPNIQPVQNQPSLGRPSTYPMRQPIAYSPQPQSTFDPEKTFAINKNTQTDRLAKNAAQIIAKNRAKRSAKFDPNKTFSINKNVMKITFI